LQVQRKSWLVRALMALWWPYLKMAQNACKGRVARLDELHSTFEGGVSFCSRRLNC